MPQYEVAFMATAVVDNRGVGSPEEVIRELCEKMKITYRGGFTVMPVTPPLDASDPSLVRREGSE